MNNYSIYHYISLYQFISLLFLFIISVLYKNIYTLSLFLFLIIVTFSVKFIKRSKYINSFYKDDINNRPSNASNCNLFNKGGDYSNKPGFPSGHTTAATFLFFIMLFEYIDSNNKEIKNKIIPFLIITLFFQITMPIARVKLNCHTKKQVYGGIITGILFAIIYKCVDKKILSKIRGTEFSINRYNDNKKSFFNIFY
jgi:membrane-associated phospholipid phosphatase